MSGAVKGGSGIRPRRRTLPRPRLLAKEDLPPAPCQRRSREKRNRLLAAALSLFGEEGYAATSVDEIAARAGVAVGGFYHYFRSKRQLLLVLMDNLLEGLSQLNLQPQAGTGARSSLRSLLKSAFATDLVYAGAYRAWQEAVLLDPALAKYQTRIQRWTRARVEAVFKVFLRLPGARTDVDVAVLARLMDRLFWDLLGQALRLPANELDPVLESTTHLLHHALFTDPEPD